MKLHIPALAVSLIFTACAQKASIPGGPKDERPPQLIEEQSTPNFQTNFEKQRVELTFDEWVELRDVFNQVVISPPFRESASKLDITLRGKTLRVDFPEEELRDRATYTINFGDAIRDFNEGNILDNFRFVFSTGAYLDSLSVRGNITDAFTGAGVGDVLVMLYENPADSVPRTERPFYFAKTSSGGNFTISNVRSDTFKVFALTDKNLNYLYDQPGEQIAFQDSLLIVTDSTEASLSLRLFEERPPLRLLDTYTEDRGLLKLLFNREPFDARLAFDTSGHFLWTEADKDTLKLWYTHPADSGLVVYVEGQDRTDTITIGPGQGKKTGRFLASIAKPSRIYPKRPLPLDFTQPLATVDTAFFFLLQDSSRKRVYPTLRIDASQKKTLWVELPWKEGVPYRIELFPGAVTNIYGMSNDSIQLDFSVGQEKDFGDLEIQLRGLQPGRQYVAELLDNAEKAVATFFAEAAGKDPLRRRGLLPGNYSLRLIEDLNGNGRWDPGQYETGRQPERLMVQPLEQLRASWQVVTEVVWKTR